MHSQNDEYEGVVRTTWNQVRNRVKNVNPKFAKLIDELSPDKYPLYLVYMPYGQLHGDTQSMFLPTFDGKSCRLNNSELPRLLIKELGYGFQSSPLGIVLEKNIEYYIDIPKLNLTLPRFLRGPGSLFPVSLIFQNKNNRNYAPNSILNAMSGCRSAFMLPNINSKSHYEKLQYDYNLKSPRPENLYQHFEIFKELSSRSDLESPWKSCIIYFSQEWVEKILNDPAWYKIKMYLGEQGLNHFGPETHKRLLDFVFSYIQTIKNLKPNPYIADTARHIIDTAIGSTPGYAPANNEDSVPISAIEKPFIESYGMKKYFPTIIQPEQFFFENATHPVYYSLQYPGTHNFSPKSRTASSMLVEMRELATILEIFLDRLSAENSLCQGTVYADLSNLLHITCMHNQDDRHKIIHSSNNLPKIDNRFNGNFCNSNLTDQRFAADGKFFRGCVTIYKKEAA